MKCVNFLGLIGSVALTLYSSQLMAGNQCHELLQFSAQKLRGEESIDFCDAFSNKALLVVNTASQCGFTPQFKELETLHKRYGDRLAIVGFPSDDFDQEHETNAKVAEVCYQNYGVTFTMVAPSRVTGDSANKLFKALAEKTGQQPTWNFNKYLISKDGKKVRHFASNVSPMSEELTTAFKSAY